MGEHSTLGPPRCSSPHIGPALPGWPHCSGPHMVATHPFATKFNLNLNWKRFLKGCNQYYYLNQSHFLIQITSHYINYIVKIKLQKVLLLIK